MLLELFFALVLVAIAAIAIITKALDATATIMAILFGAIIFGLRGFVWFFVLFLFLAVSLYATYHGKSREDEAHKTRGIDNVLSNGLVAFMSAVFGFPYMYLGSISAALADTLSSEIGVRSKKPPRMITNLKKEVPCGINGGITWLGLLAAFFGAAIIAAVACLYAPGFYFTGSRYILFMAIFVAGVLGSLVDSLLGAVFENKKQMTNGSVNFTATLVAAIIAKAITLI